ncbi:MULTISPECIES: AbiJ-NTD4 domain-containing protein [unclassified Imperialibacter]|uniref:AbiJ-NTD4 domain-containing protein n=1 Tax=unclassified Imperialibacter TaxID=2629706 RepID=UPI0012589C46|nr:MULTISPECIES: hypothetical protein [unclassified Imperialibacter]CAD5249685.1 conserved hypothetical protein [Imperialibacter sp. 89]CAD5264950.1 conserved hypothetical protein [Imperialibacter sp. 75]VVT06489.1 conserved hypothetical protein [Imperialibacter sp. EC-SDR9]
MARFSERINKREPKTTIQHDYVDQDLRNGLWNVLNIWFIDELENAQYISSSRHQTLIRSIWFSFFKEPLDTIPYGTQRIVKIFRERFYNWDYLDLYDFIDFIANENCEFPIDGFIDSCNLILKRELSGYRFVNKLLTPITNEHEIKAIESAIENATNRKFNGVTIHLNSALEKLGDKKNPDYRNSIKESISAVESLCQVISGEPSTELGKTLKLLKSKMPLHGALEQGFTKLYGYTSDGDGIRHAMMDADSLDQEDALYMLVTCSSFINYLTAKAEKAGLIQSV